MNGEIWAVGVGLIIQLIILAYNIGVFKAQVGELKNNLGNQIADLREESKRTKELLAMILVGPDVDVSLLSDTDVLRTILRRRKPG